MAVVNMGQRRIQIKTKASSFRTDAMLMQMLAVEVSEQHKNLLHKKDHTIDNFFLAFFFSCFLQFFSTSTSSPFAVFALTRGGGRRRCRHRCRRTRVSAATFVTYFFRIYFMKFRRCSSRIS